MIGHLHLITIILIVCALGSLIAGVILMASSSKLNQKYANKLMRARLIFQLLTILATALMVILWHSKQP